MADALKILTQPAVEPVTRTQAIQQTYAESELDKQFLDDAITTARIETERYCDSAFITQTWKQYLDCFPSDIIRLRKDPIQSVTSIKYIDTDGVQQTLVEGTDYQVDTVSTPPRIIPEPGITWPSVEYGRMNAVEIEYIAGYGDTEADVPWPIKKAILMLVGHYYENREEATSDTVKSVPHGWEAILMSYNTIY